MTRTTVAAALGAAAVLLLSAAPAAACPPGWGALDAPARAVAGEEIRLSGKAHVNWCPDLSSPRPTSSPTPTPAPSTSASADPILPSLRPVAYVVPGRADVEVTLARTDNTGHRRIAVVKADPAEPKGSEHSFTATVRLPDDLAAGTYLIEAKQRDGVWYGNRQIAVTRGLAATGGHSVDLVAVALLALVAGAGALVVARRFA